MKRLIQAIAIAALATLSGWAAAQAYPNRTVTLVVPFAAGGPGDRKAGTFAD